MQTEPNVKFGNVLLITIGAILLYAISAGLRLNNGIFLNAIVRNSGLSYDSVSFIVASAVLIFGITQPAFGMLALKKSNLYVLVIGISMMAIGMVATGFCTSFIALFISFAVLMSGGTGAISFGIIMSLITPKLGRRRAAVASGFISAGSGIGSTAYAPILQGMLDSVGYTWTFCLLSIPIMLLLLISIYLSWGSTEESAKKEQVNLLGMVKEALSNKAYLIITFAFFACGFHMCIYIAHVFSDLVNSGLERQTAAFAFTACGLCAMLGSLISGFASTRMLPTKILGIIYSTRVFIVIAWLLVPRNVITAFLFYGLFGLFGPATLPATSGTISNIFGSVKLPTLLGFCFLGHQIGSFASTWLGGVCFQLTGGYTVIWCVSLVFSLLAGIGCLSIKPQTKDPL